MIPNRVKDAKLMLIGELLGFQGELKKMSDEAKGKLKESIKRNGFNAPIFVWAEKNYILDGHQRIIAVKELIAEGEKFESGDKLPVVEIEADSKQQAAEMVLTYNSQYGEITNSGIKDFVADFSLDIGNIKEITPLDFNWALLNFQLQGEGEQHAGSLKEDYIMPPFLITRIAKRLRQQFPKEAIKSLKPIYVPVGSGELLLCLMHFIQISRLHPFTSEYDPLQFYNDFTPLTMFIEAQFKMEYMDSLNLKQIKKKLKNEDAYFIETENGDG